MSRPNRRQTAPLPRIAKLIYGSGELLNATSTVIILMLYLKFLIDIAGLTPFWAGICLVAGKLWDAFSDPLIGALSDRTRSRFGRRRVYFLSFCVPASAAFAAMWINLDGMSNGAKILYYAGIYVAFKTLSTALNVPYQALGNELTGDYNERTSLISYRMAFALGGGILAGVLPNLLVGRWQGSPRPELGHLLVAGVFGAMYVAVWLIMFFTINEPPSPRKTNRRRSFFRAFGLTVKSRSFRILIGIYLLAFLALDTLTAAAKFYVDDVLQKPTLMPVVMGSMLSAAIVALPAYNWAIRRYDRKRAFIAGAIVWIAGLALLSIIDARESTAQLAIAMSIVGVGVAAAFIVPWSALPEVIDVDRIVNGRAQEGIFAGVLTFLRKVTTTGALFLISNALEATGYQPAADPANTNQPESAIWAIQTLTIALPIGLLLGAIACARQYPIDRQGYRLIQKHLSANDELNPNEKSELDDLIRRAY